MTPEQRAPTQRWRRMAGILSRLVIPVPMVRVGFFFLQEDARQVVSILSRLGVCHLTRVPASIKDYLDPFFPVPFRDALVALRDQYQPLAQRWEMVGAVNLASHDDSVPSVEEMQQLAESLQEVTGQVDKIDQQRKQLDEQRAELEDIEEHVRVLSELGIELNALADLRFLHLRIGTVPQENLQRLQQSAALTEDLVLELGVRRGRAHVMVIGAGGITADLEGLLNKAHFEPIDPASSSFRKMTTDPDEIRARVDRELRDVNAQLGTLENEERALARQYRSRLLDAGRVVSLANVFIQCEGALETRAAVSCLTCWMPENDLVHVETVLTREVSSPVSVVHEPADTAGDGPPPSHTPVPKIFRPGSRLLSLYGTPAYDEINPTLFLFATTPLLFGMMFGDVGYGLLIVAVAFIFRQRLQPWIPAILSCGAASVVFGFLYGSVLGVEHWLPALWLRPMEEPVRLLQMALWIGVGFVLLTFPLKALSLWRQRARLEAVCSFHAGAGALVYVGLAMICYWAYVEQRLSFIGIGMIGGGVALLATHAAHVVRRTGKSAIADLSAEYFHGALSLLTNTLSFLRLGAFALSHAALASALFHLVEMIPPGGVGWGARAVVLIVGSTIAIALHILVVTVQTIRLQFYEGLTRYYRGDGQDYQPLRFPSTTVP